MNWKTLIAELLATGVTQKQIAEKAGCTQSVVSEIYTGVIRRPRYEIGFSIVEQHTAATKKKRSKSVA